MLTYIFQKPASDGGTLILMQPFLMHLILNPSSQQIPLPQLLTPLALYPSGHSPGCGSQCGAVPMYTQSHVLHSTHFFFNPIQQQLPSPQWWLPISLKFSGHCAPQNGATPNHTTLHIGFILSINAGTKKLKLYWKSLLSPWQMNENQQNFLLAVWMVKIKKIKKFKFKNSF